MVATHFVHDSFQSWHIAWTRRTEIQKSLRSQGELGTAVRWRMPCCVNVGRNRVEMDNHQSGNIATHPPETPWQSPVLNVNDESGIPKMYSLLVKVLLRVCVPVRCEDNNLRINHCQWSIQRGFWKVRQPTCAEHLSWNSKQPVVEGCLEISRFGSSSNWNKNIYKWLGPIRFQVLHLQFFTGWKKTEIFELGKQASCRCVNHCKPQGSGKAILPRVVWRRLLWYQ